MCTHAWPQKLPVFVPKANSYIKIKKKVVGNIEDRRDFLAQKFKKCFLILHINNINISGFV